MIRAETLSRIRSIVGPEHLITKPREMEDFGADATKLRAEPDAVAFPGNAREISQILALATQEKFPVVPRGAGSGMSGGAIPIQGGLILAMSRFNRIVLIDDENMIAKVEPGVITADLDRALKPLGLFYPPDPASIEISSIGGNVAECAGGLRAVKYGVTKDYVLGLTVVLPTGEILRTGVETMKGVAGYDLTRLIVGSEGTLAVITSITLRLLPRPEAKQTMTALFASIKAAVTTVTVIIKNRIIPTTLEILDHLCLECIRQELGMEIPQNARAMLLIEVDGDPLVIENQSRVIRDLCGKGGCLHFDLATCEEDTERLWEARRNVSPSLYKLKPHKISEDIVIPRTKMPTFIAFLSELGQKYQLPIPTFGHAGDGNLHVNIMHDKNDPSEKEKALVMVREIFKKVLELGGTITGEHGIGITKKPYLHMEIPSPGVELMARIKQAFDPAGILNPGKIFS